MSEAEHTITKVEKEKDPRRVASGKRLASISAAAKESAKRRRAEASEVMQDEVPSTPPSGGYSISTFMTGAGLLMGVACLYLAYRQDIRAQLVQGVASKSDSSSEVSPSNSVEQRRIGKQYSLDD